MSELLKQGGAHRALPELRTGIGGEAAHWYVPGDPVLCAYEIKGSNGAWRSVTLRDARKYGFVPGVTSIIKQLAAPGLERWKLQQAIMAALTHPQAKKVGDKELLRILEEDSKAEAKAAAERGTQVHGAIARYFTDGSIESEEFEPYVRGVSQALASITGRDERRLWSAEVARCHPFGFGSRVDLYAKELDIIVDLKGKEFGPADEKPEGYPEHGRQLAAYKELVGAPKARLVNLFFSRSHPGLVHPYEWPAAQHEKLWHSFVLLLQLWQLERDLPITARANI